MNVEEIHDVRFHKTVDESGAIANSARDHCKTSEGTVELHKTT